MTTNLHDKMLKAIDALFSASDAVEEEVAENLLLDVRDELLKHKLAEQPAQTEAERLADELEMWTPAELRRLVSFNQQLMDEVARLQKREWVGLTAKERSELWWKTDMSKMPEHDYGKAIEAKLREKNT